MSVDIEAAGFCFDEAVNVVQLGSGSDNCPVQVKQLVIASSSGLNQLFCRRCSFIGLCCMRSLLSSDSLKMLIIIGRVHKRVFFFLLWNADHGWNQT